MKLLIDLGNTRLKWAWSADAALRASGITEHHGAPAGIIAGLAAEGADSIWIAQVFGREHETALAEAVLARTGLRPVFAHSTACALGLHNAYVEPERLGIDRWLAMLAARARHAGAVVVADAGTALTVDGVDAQGRHLGGLIAPGLATARKALLGAVRFSVNNAVDYGIAGLGRDTEGCVAQGAMLACLGAIERAAATVTGPKRCYLTGGDAAVLHPHLAGDWELRPLLVLEGLQALALADAG